MLKRSIGAVAVAAVLAVGGPAAGAQALTLTPAQHAVAVAPSGGFKTVLCRALKAKHYPPAQVFRVCNPFHRH